MSKIETKIKVGCPACNEKIKQVMSNFSIDYNIKEPQKDTKITSLKNISTKKYKNSLF